MDILFFLFHPRPLLFSFSNLPRQRHYTSNKGLRALKSNHPFQLQNHVHARVFFEVGNISFVHMSLPFCPAHSGSIAFRIPGARLERFLHDVCHSQLLGTGKVTNGSALVYLAEGGAFGHWPRGRYDRSLGPLLKVAFVQFGQWKKRNKIQSTQPRFTLARLNRKFRVCMPSLNSKAVPGKHLTLWLSEVAQQHAARDGSTLLDRQVACCIWSYAELLRLMDEQNLLLSADEAESFYQLGQLHLLTYTHLRSLSSAVRGKQPNRRLWALIPKHHHMMHMLSTVRQERVSPKFCTLLCAESFIGAISRIARICHCSTVSQRVLQRYFAKFQLLIRHKKREQA